MTSHVNSIRTSWANEARKTILKNISWQIAKGDKWILYGLNGAGKTTLLNILNAYEPATTGGVNLFGKMPGKVGYSAETVRQHIGFVSHSLLEKFQEGERVIDVVISGALNQLVFIKILMIRYVMKHINYLN